MESSATQESAKLKGENEELAGDQKSVVFQMPVHYPKYTRAEYEAMPEWMLDCMLAEYGLQVNGGLDHKRKFAMGAFLWTN